MKEKGARHKSITEIFEEGTAIDEALARAVRQALRFHKKLGNPIAVWEDGRVVWIPPEQIQVDEAEETPDAAGEIGDPSETPP
jgi:hypothetical protein